MRKVWIYKRKSIKGWWVGWYESGKRKTKALPSKALAEHFRQIKYAQLNSDVFKIYTNVDPILLLRNAVDKIPVNDWL